MENTPILMNLGTNVDLTIAFVTSYSILHFLLPWQWGDISKLPKITISIKNDFKVLQLLIGLRVCKRLFSLKVCLKTFLACHLSKIFLEMREATTPLQTRKQKGANSRSGNPLFYLFDRGVVPEKCSLFMPAQSS
jgi:hypothetical protein